MKKQTEYIYLDTSQYYTQYMIVPFTDVRVVRVDENKNELYELQLKSFGSLLGQDDYSIDIDRGLILFSPQNIGNLFKIEYYTENIINPFKISENIFQLAEIVLQWTQHRIVSGMYFWRENYDEQWILKFERGDFVYNGEYYTCKSKVYDFRYMNPPTVQDKFRGYMFFINQTETIDRHDNLYKPLMVIDEVSYLYTTTLYDFRYQAKSELLGRYREIYKNEDPLIVAFIYLRVDTDYRFWIEYPKESRAIKLPF